MDFYRNTYFKKGMKVLVIPVAALIVVVMLLGRFNVLNKKAYLEIEVSNEKRMFEGEVIGGMTIWEAVYAASLSGDISLNYDIDQKDGKIVIRSLDGYSKDKVDKSLVFYLNQSRINTDQIYTTPINPGDTIRITAE